MKANRYLISLNAIFVSLAIVTAGRTQPKLTPIIFSPSTDQVAVIGLDISPSRPEPGQLVTVKLAIVNLTKSPLDIQWRIAIDGQDLGSGVKEGVRPGGSGDYATATWTSTGGGHHLTGEADPKNKLNEPEPDRRNNTRSLDISVGRVPIPRQSPPAPSSDKVQVTDFSITPTAPVSGGPVTVKMTIKNLTNGVLNIPWRIATTTVVSNVKENVGGGSSFEVSARWTATPGQQHFFGDADPDNSLQEPQPVRRNNTKGLDFNVAPRRVTRVFDYAKFRQARAGGSLGLTIDPPGLAASCTETSTPQDPGQPTEELGFRVGCSFPFGATGNFEGLFALHNDWKVKSVDLVRENKTGNAGWRWDDKPLPGDTRPHLKIHFWVQPGGQVSVFLRIVIEGPEDKDPFAQ